MYWGSFSGSIAGVLVAVGVVWHFDMRLIPAVCIAFGMSYLGACVGGINLRSTSGE